VQNNGTPYYKIASNTTGELGTLLNAVGVNIVYIGIVYFINGTITPAPVIYITTNFSANPPVSGILARLNLSNTATDPTVAQFSSFTPISTATPKAVRLYLSSSGLSGSNYVNLRIVVIGFNFS